MAITLQRVNRTDPIPFMFGSRVEFSGTADRTAPFPVVSGRHFENAYSLPTIKISILIRLSVTKTIEFGRVERKPTSSKVVLTG